MRSLRIPIAIQRISRRPQDPVAAAYWQHRQAALTSFLRRDNGDHNHNHCGIGPYDRSLLDSVSSDQQAQLLAEMHRMESAQSERLLSLLRAVDPLHHLLDAGCGRGGTSLAAAARFDCFVDGVDLASSQVEHANRLATERGYAHRIKFHQRNLCDTGFAAGHFDSVIANEVTMYVDLADALREFHRVLRPGGQLVLFTWCCRDASAASRLPALVIDALHVCRTHSRPEYFQALAEHSFSVQRVDDLSLDVGAYFDLRRHIHGFGSEDSADEAFRAGLQSGALMYLAVVARTIPTGLPSDSQTPAT